MTLLIYVPDVFFSGFYQFSGAEHFRSKDYELSVDMFEKSMLYVPRDEEHQSRRANCFRVLSLCHLGLQQIDRAQEFIEQAEKVQSNP